MTVQTSATEIQTAICQLLSPSNVVDTQLATLGCVGVYDFRNVPQNKIFDYITLGDVIEMPQNTFGRRGYDTQFTIHIWSRSRGTAAANGMLARINKLIDQQPLTLASQAHVYTLYNRSRRIADPDGLTLHLVATYTTYTEE